MQTKLRKLFKVEIDTFRKKNKLSSYNLSHITGRQHPYGLNITRGIHMPSVEDLAKLCVEFGLVTEKDVKKILWLDYEPLLKEIKKLKK